ARIGVRPGQPVLTLAPNSFESYYAWLGVAMLKAIEVPTNTMYRGAMLAHLKTVVVPDADSVIPDRPFDAITGDDFLRDAPLDTIGDGPEYYDVACMIYTSGTTGPSKGVLVPWAE